MILVAAGVFAYYTLWVIVLVSGEGHDTVMHDPSAALRARGNKGRVGPLQKWVWLVGEWHVKMM